MGSFSLSGGVEVFGFISPSDTTDTYPVIDPLYGIDGLRNVDFLSDLDNIPTLRRRAGMVVGVSGGTTYYKLNPGPWNNTITDWSVFSSGGGVSGDYLPLSGGTVTGNTIFTNGLTANTISGGTFFGDGSGLSGITDTFVTGATFSGTTLIINQNENQPDVTATLSSVSLSGALSSITFNIVSTAGISASTISATTYQNLPIGSSVTSFTYNNNTFTIFQSSGTQLNATINTMTGLTINGISSLNGTISSTSLSGTTDRMVQVDSGGTMSASVDIVQGYLTSGGTVANLLEDTNNWDINGNYTGTTITGTFQGQKYYDNNYFFEAVADNLFIRLIRG